MSINRCEQVRLNLAAGEGAVGPEQRAHLLRCADCAELARDVARLGQLARALPRLACPTLVPAGARRRPHGRWLALAVAACLALALVGGVLWLRGSAPPAVPSPGPTRVPAGDEPDLLAVISSAQAVWSDAGDEGWGSLSRALADGPMSALTGVASGPRLEQDTDDFDGWLASIRPAKSNPESQQEK
jgi:hypothetical protein